MTSATVPQMGSHLVIGLAYKMRYRNPIWGLNACSNATFLPFCFLQEFLELKNMAFLDQKKIPLSVKRNRLLCHVRLPDSDGDKKKCFNNYLLTRHVGSRKNSIHAELVLLNGKLQAKQAENSQIKNKIRQQLERPGR